MDLARRRAATAVLAASLIAIVPAGVAAQDDAVTRVVDAVGGAEALGALDAFVVEASGTRNALDEGPTPGGPAGLGSSFESVATLDIAGDSIRVDYSIGATEFGQPRDVSEVVIGDVGYVDGQNSIVAPPGVGPLLSDRVASIRVQQELLNPHLLLLDVLAGERQASASDDTLEIAHGVTPVTIALDPATGLPATATKLESDPLRRDVEVVASYADWTESDAGVWFPGSVAITYDGQVVHEETRTVSTGIDVDDSAFAIPEGIEMAFDADLAARGEVNHQHLQSFEAIGFPLDGLQPFVQATELVPGVFHLTGGSHNSLAIVQDDGVVIVDAPLNEVRTAGLLGWLESEGLGPVTHVVQSHHHVDHAGGLRSLAGQTGAVVVAGEAAIPFYETEVFASPSDVVPDGVDGSAIETMAVGDGPVIIGTGSNPVTVYPFPNEHAEDYVLVEAGGVLFVVDIYNPGLGFGAPPPALFDWVESQGVAVDLVAGGHGGVDRWADLVAAREG